MLSIVIATYGQPMMLAKQLETIASYGDDVYDRVCFRIVDDCGSPPVMHSPTIRTMADHLDLRVFRVLEDIPWNQMGARNIGMKESPPGPCIMLDTDMIIDPGQIKRFLKAGESLAIGHAVKFGLKHMSGNMEIDMSSPNTWIIRRGDFFKFGGYDEDFRGHKGWSDCLMQETLRAFLTVEERPDLFVNFYIPSNGPKDSQVMTSAGVNRDVSYNKTLKLRKNAAISQHGGHVSYIKKGLKGKNFRCKWKRVL